jgi:hypothetical protein
VINKEYIQKPTAICYTVVLDNIHCLLRFVVEFVYHMHINAAAWLQFLLLVQTCHFALLNEPRIFLKTYPIQQHVRVVFPHLARFGIVLFLFKTVLDWKLYLYV